MLEIVKRNGEFTGIIHQTKTGPFVAIDTPTPASPETVAESETILEPNPAPPVVAEKEITEPDAGLVPMTTATPRVFITHGKKSAKIVEQLKDLVTFGKFEPVVAKEHETPTKPVPDKVMDDMRSCSAAIIHVAEEERLLDAQGNEHIKLKENVLIEIGAAMALYGRNFILLVQKDIRLPSNLQGLYLCEYERETLDYEATMKLLKAFNEFR